MINKTIKGDLIKLAKQGEFDVIVHGCNCFCTMGKGIALQIKREFPEAYECDKASGKGDFEKLGTFETALCIYGDHQYLQVLNAYTQYDYRGKNPVEYTAIRDVFKSLNEHAMSYSGRIGIPKIGSGLAGGNWGLIMHIINSVTPDLDITLVEWDG